MEHIGLARNSSTDSGLESDLDTLDFFLATCWAVMLCLAHTSPVKEKRTYLAKEPGPLADFIALLLVVCLP